MKKINKILTIMITMLLTLVAPTFAVGGNTTNTTVVSPITNTTVSAGITPDSPFYFVQTITENIKLTYVKLTGNRTEINNVEKQIIAEKIAELRVVSPKNKLSLRNDIDSKIQEISNRDKTHLDNIKKRLDNNPNDVNLQNEVKNVETQINDNKNTLNNEVQNVETFRTEQHKTHIERIKGLNNNYNDFVRNNPNEVKKFDTYLSNYNNKTFEIKTNKRLVDVRVENNRLHFLDNSSNVDYNINVKNEQQFKDMIDKRNFDLQKFNNNVDMPISLKTSLFMNFMNLFKSNNVNDNLQNQTFDNNNHNNNHINDNNMNNNNIN